MNTNGICIGIASSALSAWIATRSGVTTGAQHVLPTPGRVPRPGKLRPRETFSSSEALEPSDHRSTTVPSASYLPP
jgi:hypothetical protein